MSFLFLLPLLLGLLFFFGVASDSVVSLLQMQKICLKNQTDVFQKQRKRILQLMGLNPKAAAYQFETQSLLMQKAAAAAAGNVATLTALEIRWQRLQILRQKLDLKQKFILSSANEEFTRALPLLSFQLNQAWRRKNNQTLPIPWRLELSISKPHTLVLAVEPDSPDLAPTYRHLPQFEKIQSWSQSWILKVQNLSRVKDFVNFDVQWEMKCSSTLKREREGYSIAPEVKFLSR